LKSFNTLKGFITGEEPKEMKPVFAHNATLRIFSEAELDFEELGAVLGVTPTMTARRGQRVGPRSPPVKGDVWMYRTPVAEEKDLHEHIDALWRTLKPNVPFLRALKARATVEVFLGYSSNIDHAGIRVPYASLELFTALELDFSLSIIVLVPD
jgi:hypothetical protein